MENDTDIKCNWILDEKLTEISFNLDNKVNILSNIENEISIKAKEIDNVYSISENEIKRDFNINTLPLYFPQKISAKRISSSLNHTQNTQRWVGYIIEINERKFKAKLEDITAPGTFEIGTFDIHDKDLIDEKEMIQIGAVFYLSVGYDVSRGTFAKQKLIRFQRLTKLTESDFNNAIDRADRIASSLNWE
ncbi:MAG: hypothetical protein M0R16_11590 [Bacteroidales bacterium]|nr:hypothetical protein [Bacteroidales bacterium]